MIQVSFCSNFFFSTKQMKIYHFNKLTINTCSVYCRWLFFHIHNIFVATIYCICLHTQCHRKNRYNKIFYHSRINWATSLAFSGPVYHPMEQLMYKFHLYISDNIDFIQLFVTYPYLLKTNKCVKKCFLTPLASIRRNGHGITNDWPRPPHDT